MNKLLQLLQPYKHTEWNIKPNKTKIPLTEFQISDREKFNEIYRACVESGIMRCEPEPSGAIPYNHMVKWYERYMILARPVTFELDVLINDGMWRFILYLGRKAPENIITGSESLEVLLKTAKRYGVLDTFVNGAVGSDEGHEIKQTINSPIIQVSNPKWVGQEIDNIHHLDLNSSYASRIAEAHPELRPMYEELYTRRKEANGYYKHVLTNSVGAMQSRYCYNVTDYGEKYFARRPYALASFAREAVNGTNDKINELTYRLNAAGRRPILYNTDGIWYQGDVYHDADEGTGLCQWKSDETNCRLYIKSKGAYQYMRADGTVKSVVRGSTRLDLTKPDRSTWEWREIDNFDHCCEYKWDDAEGVSRINLD